jgi:predicted CXXCH cytochrome family protein
MCHVIEAGLYVISPHYEAFESQNLSMCGTCHSNHGIAAPTHALIGLENGQLCASCHNAEDATEAPEQIVSMSAAWAGLTREVDSARYLANEAAVRGMMTTDEEFALKEIDEILIHMRASVHAFAADSLTPLADDGIEKSKAVQVGAAGLIDEYYFRRWGLGISSFIITVLAFALYVKIRKHDKART